MIVQLWCVCVRARCVCCLYLNQLENKIIFMFFFFGIVYKDSDRNGDREKMESKRVCGV